MQNLKAANAARWDKARLTRGPEFIPVARRLVAAKSAYMEVAELTGVPWFFIAVTHEREASQSWLASLAQGDPWNKRSTHVPVGRGPFKSWKDAAVDALKDCPPYAARNLDWSAGGTLAKLEEYNGLGYAAKGLPSPYIWSGTDQYISGKYVADHVFDPHAVDKQLGCAGLLLAMATFDPSVRFGSIIPSHLAGASPAIVPPSPTSAPPPVVAMTPSPASPQKPSGIAAWIASLFHR